MDASGIRKVFDLASKLTDPVNLSIGLPDFDVPAEAKKALGRAVAAGRNRYTPSAGIPELRKAVRARCSSAYGFEPEEVMITSGSSGGLTLALLAAVDPGDEVLVPDPFFVSYRQLALMAGATPVYYDTYPDFKLRREALDRVVTGRAKVLVLNSPANPTGAVLGEPDVRAACDFARAHDLLIVSDEVYDPFWYETRPTSPARFYEKTVTLNGWSKSHAMTGWRAGWASGPAELINEMIKLQQFTYVCAPAPVQHAVLDVIGMDTEPIRQAYLRKRDMACDILSKRLTLVRPQGAFYAFPEAKGNATAFVTKAIERGILVIPGAVFSTRDTNLRISFATDEETLERGCTQLVALAEQLDT
jgi:aspartate aminotransferase/aminotransferase